MTGMQLFKDILLTVAVVVGGILMIRFGTSRNSSGFFGGSSDTGSSYGGWFDDSSSDSGSCDSGDGGSCD